MKNVSFIVDGMLGSLARKLRIYGFDVFYNPTIKDEDVIEIASRENRIILSRDKELCRKALVKGLNALYIEGRDDVERIAFIFKKLNIKKDLDLLETRCPLCNARLSVTSREYVKSVPKGVLERHSVFYVCENCGQVYWKGSHWEKLLQMDREVKAKLSKR